MSNVKQLVTQLFKNNQITIPENRQPLFEEFLQDKQNLTIINTLMQNQNELMAKWKLQDRIEEIMQQPIRLANATVGKPYQSEFDLEKLNWSDIISFEWDGLERV